MGADFIPDQLKDKYLNRKTEINIQENLEKAFKCSQNSNIIENNLIYFKSSSEPRGRAQTTLLHLENLNLWT